VLVLASGGNMLGLVVPFALMALGGVIVFRAIMQRQ